MANSLWRIWNNLSVTTKVMEIIKPIQESELTQILQKHSTGYGFWTNFAIETNCFMDYLNWHFFRAIWLLPYFFRILKLYQIWNFHEVYIRTEDQIAIENHELNPETLINEQNKRIQITERRQRCKTYFISERNVIFWFFIVMIPFAILAVVSPFLHFINRTIPSLMMQQCCESCDQQEYQQLLDNAMIELIVN